MAQSGPQADESAYLELRDRWRALFVLFCGLALSFAITLWSKERIRPRNLHRATVSSLRGVVGWPKAVDAIASLDGARRFSHVRELQGIVVDGVNGDGRLELSDNGPSVKYVFQSGPRRRRDGQTQSSATRLGGNVCPRQIVKLNRDGLAAEPEDLSASCPREPVEPLAIPRCGPKQVIIAAAQVGFKRERLARIEYTQTKIGAAPVPVWKMSVPVAHFSMVLSADCSHVYTREELNGRVP